MKPWPWVLLAWATVAAAFWAACNVVHLTNQETCQLVEGDWNEAWARCYP